MNEIITEDGEIIESMGTQPMAIQLQRAEIDQVITTARAYPRSLKRVQSAIMNMATLDEESAEECMYALPRGGKPIKGPSVRFAEILKQAYGNCRVGARVVAVDRTEGYVEAEGVFHDLETNSSTTARVRRRITDKRGKIFTDDMIIVTGNAACSIAKRNAILDGVPKPLWRKAYEVVQATITGDITTLSENREKAFKALAAFGAAPELIFGALGREGMEDITVDDIATMRGMYSALKNGEATVEEMFVGTVKAASQHAKVDNPFDDEGPAKQTSKKSVDEKPAEEKATVGTKSDEPAKAGVKNASQPQAKAAADSSEQKKEPDDQSAASDKAPTSKAEGSSSEASDQSEASPDKGKGGSADTTQGQNSAADAEPTAADQAGASPSSQDAPADNEPKDVPLSDDVLRAYNDALWKAETVEAVTDTRKQFWSSRPLPTGERDHDTLRAVLTVHIDMRRGKIARDHALADLAEIIPDEEMNL